ncbi:discoidin domain-containing protein [Actinospica sp. MGRD01-02]|uniref:Discoidin domain-containing protein n=1 Tax=Actinospica acidithermotolerans TaxID=2828514 RepID=A0A941ELE4_9ACTN|nr:discoidin domain-containing protein [Actinospica acidithermotolerans]MBR7829714.1 discoidin domain-containing protein [Actinospica acidithermotolerans]
MSSRFRPLARPPRRGGQRRRLTALAVAAATALFTLPGVLLASPASAAAGTPPYWAQSPFSVPSGVGASVPFTEYEAESASTNGSIIGPSYTQGALATEASGREAVQLSSQGQYVQFTLTSAANAVDLHYAVPQGSSGTLSVYVNGTKLGSELSLTSAYSYISTSGITGSQTHKLYDDARMMFGQTYAAGTTVKFQVDSSDTATPYTIDVADFYNVAGAATQPANTVSVVSEGADATGASDSTNAFNSAITAANAAGEAVWIPSGTYLVSGHLNITNGTIEGAGDWYSQIKSNELIDNTSAVSGAVNLSGFAILGSTVGRHDDSTSNAIDGSLGNGWTVNGLWIQDTNVGFWLQYGNSNCTVENSVIESTDADGVNFNGNASNCTVKNNFLRNTGDDSLAIWSYPTADSGITFANNTIVQPTLANGIADYGGSNNTISNNVVADTEPLGSGIDISNEAFLQPFTPLSGTITVSGNYVIRSGEYNPNWGHPMGAVQFDAYNSDFTGVTVNYSGGAILDSPYEAFEFVGGDGTGHVINGVNISNVNVQNTGTTVMQAETGGTVSVSGLTASGIGVAGAYNYSYPGLVSGAMTFNLGSGNSGWSTTPVLTAYPNPVQAGSLTASTTSLSFGDVNSGSISAAQTVTINNPGSSAASVSSIGVTGEYSETNTCGSSIAAGGSCTVSVKFSPTSGGSQTGTLSVATSAPGSPLTVSLSGTGVTSTTNLAQNQPITASSSYETYVASNAVDGDSSTYWESTDGAAYPQTLTVDLGSTQSIGSVTLDLPPATAWSTRTETLSVLGSTNGSSYSTIVGSAGYTFNPSTGNTVTISLPSGTSARYVQLSFTANTGWSAAQLSEFEVFPGGSSTGTGSALTASPASVSFGNENVGSTSAAQTVTVSNPGSTAATVSSISAAAPFAETNTCGSSIAAGGSCTVSVTFKPTAAGSASGTLSVASSAPGSPLSVALSGTGVSTNTNLALNQPVSASGYTQTYVPANAVDGNTSTYWESTDNAFPQWFQVDLGSSVGVGRIVMDLPPSTAWATRSQTIQIQGSTDGTNYTTLVGSASYTFDPSTGNTVTVTFTSASVRYVKLTFTANSGWPAGQLSELQVYGS